MTQPAPVETFTANIADIAKSRHAAKAYKREDLTEAQIDGLLDLLRFSASSVNCQPWHVIVATTEDGRDRIAKAGTDGTFEVNSGPIRKCGLVAVFAARQDTDDAYLDHLLEVEAADGRFPTEEKRQGMKDLRKMFIDVSRDRLGSVSNWMARQVYWNGGQFLLGAAAMGLDATPMEGLNVDGLDAEFGLAEKGYRTLFAITVGRNDDADDWNFGLPKSRLPLDEITTRI